MRGEVKKVFKEFQAREVRSAIPHRIEMPKSHESQLRLRKAKQFGKGPTMTVNAKPDGGVLISDLTPNFNRYFDIINARSSL